MHTWDVIVVGLGAMGSATVAELAARGVRVLGLDRFEPPHTLGSSHGETRIIREAYFEHPQYVPLVKRAYDCWHRLEAETGQRLFRQTGGLSIGLAGGALVSGALASAREHGLAYELLDADAVARDHPALRLEPDWVAVREPRAGILFPERCVAAHLLRARRAGATLRTHTPVTGWQVERDTVTVDAGGERFSAGRLVLAAGPWVGALLADLALPLVVARQVVHWFGEGSAGADVGPDALPVFLIEHEPDRMIYGFPQLDAPLDGGQPEMGPGVKLSRHHEGAVTTADDVVRAVTTEERGEVEQLRRRYLPSVDGPYLRSSVCLYTNTPDLDFLIDWHPHHAAVLVVSACSGHGFKFSSAIGEVAADLVTTGRAQFDVSPFGYGRWAR